MRYYFFLNKIFENTDAFLLCLEINLDWNRITNEDISYKKKKTMMI